MNITYIFSLRGVTSLCLFLIIVFTGCENRPSKDKTKDNRKLVNGGGNGMTLTESSAVQLVIPEELSVLDVDQAVKEMKYIKLETTDDCLIGRINKIVFYKNNIYILDKGFSKAIHIFNMEGKYVNSINKQGRGPKEYIAIKDFCFFNDSLLVYDDLGSKILVFDEKGDYNSFFKVPFAFREFSPFNENQLLFLTRAADNSFDENIEDYSLLIGTKDSIKYKGFENSSFLKEFNRTETYTSPGTDNEYFYSPFLSNTIYQINQDGSYSVKYNLLFPKSLPENLTSKLINNDFDSYTKKSGFYYFMGKFHESSDHLFLRYYPPSDYFAYAIYDKNKDKLLAFDGYNSSKQFLGFSTPITVYNDYFVAILDPANLNNVNRDMVNKTVGNINEGDNPILILYKFN